MYLIITPSYKSLTIRFISLPYPVCLCIHERLHTVGMGYTIQPAFRLHFYMVLESLEPLSNISHSF